MNESEKKKYLFYENIDSVIDEYDDYNSYYGIVAVIFRVISFALFACLLLFVIASAFAGAEEFSYANLEYITRNFALTLEEKKDSARQPIRYNPDRLNQFSLFGDGLAVCGSSSLAIFSATGRQTCSETIQFRSPVMISSDKYVLVYDEGDGFYRVFNSFASVYSDVLNTPIKGAALADNGYYALLSSSDEYNSSVEVYNSDFSLVSRYNKNAYVSCLDITNDEVLIVSANTKLGTYDFCVEVLVAGIGEPNAKFTVDLTSSFPLDCQVTEYGYVIVCTDSVIFIDEAGTVIGEYSFDHMSLTDFAVSSTNVLLLFKTKQFEIGYDYLCIEPKGDVLYSGHIAETVFAIELYDDRSWILSESGLFYAEKGVKKYLETEVPDFACSVYAVDKENFYFCSETGASFFSVGSERD